MAEFMRPEARATLLRWREALIGGALSALGLYWALTGFGTLRWLGWAVLALGLTLLLTGLQRGRFRGQKGAPGMVQLDERQLSYFGPLTGGVIDLDEMRALDWEPSKPGHWVLTGADHNEVHIPNGAEGADQLFDAFSALPGLSAAKLIEIPRQTGKARIAVWRAPPRQLF
ncbi:MAG: hypothetical protein JKX69_08000 [Rhodobacteraceae bacterium]|nr:hypothetical protein [Paracoccaceae bacterium]